MNYNKLPKEYGKFVELKDTPNINTLDGWESPVKIVTENVMKLVEGANDAIEGKIMEAITKVGIDVDKDELLRAIQYDRDQYSKGYLNGYNAGYNANKWISVEDRLPETDNKNTHEYNVLVYIPQREGCRQHGMYLGKIRKVEGDDGKGNFWGIKTEPCEWTVWGWSYFEHPVVTHWMPLPEPPQMEEE